MIVLAFMLAAVATTSAAPVRSFWKLEEAPRPQPVQSRIVAELVQEGSRLVVYRERGYRFSTLGEPDEVTQIASAIAAFDGVIYPKLVDLFGPCPDLDGNGKVILLLTRATRDENTFLAFDQMPDARATAYGVHSNEGEIIYLSFGRQGTRATGNLAALAAGFHLILHSSHDDREVAWAELLANYSAVACNLVGKRALWGDGSHLVPSPAPSDPWSTDGWPLLLLEYLRQHRGDQVLRDLVRSPRTGLLGLEDALAAQEPPQSFAGMAADFAMACWLDDTGIAGGRFAFHDLAPPRPPRGARGAAARPPSSQISCGAGGIVHLLVEGDGEHPLPLALRGDPRVRWLGRAVHLRQRGPDEELALEFDPSGLARLELPLLPTGDGVVIAVMPQPAATPDLDRRRFALLWGLGWVPRSWSEQDATPLAELAERSTVPGLVARVARAADSLDRLGGLAPPADGVEPLATR